MKIRAKILLIAIAGIMVTLSSANAQDEEPKRTMFTNVNVFDGFADELAMNTDVLVEGNHIVEVGQNLSAPGATVIDGGGRTLMPGLIDMHTHVTFESTAGTNGFNVYDFGGAGAMAAQALRDNMLMKGITTGRDIAGNSRGIARLILGRKMGSELKRAQTDGDVERLWLAIA